MLLKTVILSYVPVSLPLWLCKMFVSCSERSHSSVCAVMLTGLHCVCHRCQSSSLMMPSLWQWKTANWEKIRASGASMVNIYLFLTRVQAGPELLFMCFFLSHVLTVFVLHGSFHSYVIFLTYTLLYVTIVIIFLLTVLISCSLVGHCDFSY